MRLPFSFVVWAIFLLSAAAVGAQCVPPVPRTYILSATPGEQQPYGVLNNNCPPSRASGVNCTFTLKTGYTLISGTLTIGCSGTTNTWTTAITGASCTVPALPAGAVAEAGCTPGATLASDAFCYYNVSNTAHVFVLVLPIMLHSHFSFLFFLVLCCFLL